MHLRKVAWGAFKTLSKLNLGKSASKLYLRTVDADSFPDVDPEIPQTDFDTLPNGDVIVPVVQGEANLTYRYCILAHALRQRGYNPIIPLCESSVPICFRRESGQDHEAICDRCIPYGTRMLERFGLEYVSIDEVPESPPTEIIPSSRDDTVIYEGMDISNYARASTRRFLKKRQLNFDDEYEWSVYRRFLATAKTLVDTAEEMIKENNVVSVIGSDPSYVYGGLFLRIGEKYDIPAKSIGIGYYRDKTVMIGDQRNRSPLPQYTDYNLVEELLSQPLDGAANREVEEYMENRYEGDFDGVSFTKETDDNIDSTYETMVGVFTNLMWDGALEADELTAFSDPFRWLKTTIDYFSDEESVQLIIKTHPAEGHRPANETVEEWIDEHYTTLSDNILVLPPKTDVSPYKLMSQLDMGIVWNSTIGLEMAYHSVPTVTVGDAHYKEHGFTFDPEIESEYLELLSGDMLEMDETMRQRAKRYAHLVFFKKQIEFPFYSRDEKGASLQAVDADDLASGNENIDLIIESIVNGSPAIKRNGQ